MLDDDLTNLEDWLRQLKVEYGIYFNGNRKKPPDDLRMRVEKLLKRLSEVSSMSCSQRFRFNTLITRYYVHRDLWRRTMKERELIKENEALNLPELAPSSDQPAAGITILIADPIAEGPKVRQLYDALTLSKPAIREDSSSDFLRAICQIHQRPNPEHPRQIPVQQRGIYSGY